MNCSKCNNAINKNSKFCGKCGSMVGKIEKLEIDEVNNSLIEKNAKPDKINEKNINKYDVIGFILGISIAWSIGLTGFIPYILGALIGTWVARKMLGGKKQYIKIIFWILLALLFIGGLINRSIKPESKNSVNDPILLETDKSLETSEISGNMYRNTKYGFRIKFPENWKIEVGDGIHIVQKASSEDGTISIMVQQLDLGNNKGFDSIKDAGEVKEFINSAMEGVNEKFSNIQTIDYGETKIDNEPAYWVEYSTTSQILDQTLDMTNLVYFLAKDDIIYSINAGTASKIYSRMKPIFSESVGTFVLENY